MSLFTELFPFGLTALVVLLIVRWRSRSSVKPADNRYQRLALIASIWTILQLAAMTALPALHPLFRIRYGILVLTPLALLVGLGLRIPGNNRPLKAAIITILALQFGWNFMHSVQVRRFWGGVIVPHYKMAHYVADNFPEGTLLMYNVQDFGLPGDDTHVIKTRKMIQSRDEIRNDAGTPLLLLTSTPVMTQDIKPISMFEGDTESLFDQFFTASGPRLYLNVITTPHPAVTHLRTPYSLSMILP